MDHTASFFLSLAAGRADCIHRDNQAYISLGANEGQKVKLTITDFSRQNNTTEGQTKFEIEENGQSHNMAFTQNVKGDMEAEYISSVPRATLVLKDLSHNALISYQGKYQY